MAKLFRILCLLAFFLPALTSAGAAEAFSHDDWETVLMAYVNDRGLVDYVGLSTDRVVFDRYIAGIESIGPDSHPSFFPTPDAKLAYYINAYNAMVFKGVLARGPEDKSVWTGIISGFRFFQWMDIIVDGQKTSLQDLENRIIRAEFKDPRIHAAVNCASISCPRLPRYAFHPDRLQAQLDEAMAEFVSNETNVQIRGKTLYLSRIFDWFRDDFLDFEHRQGALNPVLIDYINRYRAPDQQLASDLDIRFFNYDKGINSQ